MSTFCEELSTYSSTLIKDSGYPHDGRADKNPYPPSVVPIRILIRTTAIISALS